jgi:hypothetical protein
MFLAGQPAGGAQAARGGHFTLATVKFHRPANEGPMNEVPSFVTFDNWTSIAHMTVTHAGGEQQPHLRDVEGIRLVGGDMVVVFVRGGAHTLRAVTPVADQKPKPTKEKKPQEWRSRSLKISTAALDDINILVAPTKSGSSYNGGWRLSKLRASDKVPSKM